MTLQGLLNVTYSSLLEVKDAALLEIQTEQRERLDEILGTVDVSAEEREQPKKSPPQRRPPGGSGGKSSGDIRALMAAAKLPQVGASVRGRKHGPKRGGRP